MIKFIWNEIKKGADLAQSHGEMRRGKGMVSGIIALFLANFCLLGALALQFPTWLTTPKVREVVSFETIRITLISAMFVCGVIAIYNVLNDRIKRLSSWALLWLSVSLLVAWAGAMITGHGFLEVNSADIKTNIPYLGFDWLILDMLLSLLIFTSIEKLMPLKKELPVFRKYWQTDFMYFLTGHIFVGLTLFLVYSILFGISNKAHIVAPDSVSQWIQGLPFIVELLLLMLITDFARYWLHRLYHETAWGWRLHAIHHSAEDMDWISGSRTHGIEIIISTVVILAPAFLLGFSQNVINLYIVIAGVQAVFNHTNVSVRLGPLRYIIVTPNFHHWHHTRDEEGLDRCYAAHFAFWDYLFGTAVKADKNKKWPDAYGVVGDYVPQGFWAQQVFPFTWSGRWKDRDGKDRTI